LAVFTFNETKEAIKKLYPLRIPILLNGATGVGKTAIVREVAEELGLPLINIWLAQETPKSIGEIPERNYFFPAFESGAVFFFEHLNRSTPWVREAVMSVFSERTLGGKKLHPDTLVIGAVNTGEDYTNTDDLEEDLLAEFAIINVVADIDEFLSYLSEGRSVGDDVFDLALALAFKDKEFRDMFLYEANLFSQLNPSNTSKNLKFALKVIKMYYNDPFLRKLLYTVISPDFADELLAFLDFSLIKLLVNSILAGQDVEVEESRVPVILAVIASMQLSDNEFSNAIKFAKKFYEGLGIEDGIVGFLFNLARRNRELLIRHIRYINNEFPNLKSVLSL
jgi:hypothetical protein